MRALIIMINLLLLPALVYAQKEDLPDSSMSQLLKRVDSMCMRSPSVQDLLNKKEDINTLVLAAIESQDDPDVRKELLHRLNSKYPDFLKGLRLETDLAGTLAERLRLVNEQYDAWIKVNLTGCQVDALKYVQSELTKRAADLKEMETKLRRYSITKPLAELRFRDLDNLTDDQRTTIILKMRDLGFKMEP